MHQSGFGKVFGLGIPPAKPAFDARLTPGVSLATDRVPPRRLVQHHELAVLKDDIRTPDISVGRTDLAGVAGSIFGGGHWASIR